MTTLYKPVKIESVEQADALPRGVVVFDGSPEDGDTYTRAGGEWRTSGYPGLLSEALALGFAVTALVPIKAEKEWAAEFDSGELYMNLDEDSARGADGGAAMSRFVTPWEEVSDKP